MFLEVQDQNMGYNEPTLVFEGTITMQFLMRDPLFRYNKTYKISGNLVLGIYLLLRATHFGNLVISDFLLIIIYIGGMNYHFFKYPEIVSGVKYLLGRKQIAIKCEHTYCDLAMNEAIPFLARARRIIPDEPLFKKLSLFRIGIPNKIGVEPKNVFQRINQCSKGNFREYPNEINIQRAMTLVSNRNHLQPFFEKRMDLHPINVESNN